MRSVVALVLTSLLLTSAGYGQVILLPPQPPSYGSTARGYPGINSAPGYGVNSDAYPRNPRLGGMAGDLTGLGLGSATGTIPCGTGGIDAPQPGQFRAPISPNYRAFSDRFAPPTQRSNQLPDACN